jgi:hypothetical protein
MCVEKWADFLTRSADGHGSDAEESAEEVHGGQFAQVEHGGQDSVRWGELGFGACSGCDQTLVPTTCAEHFLALHLQRRRQSVDELAELSAGHPGQFRGLQRMPREARRSGRRGLV